MTNPNFEPDFYSPPGDTILDCMEAKGWTVPDMAYRLGLTLDEMDCLLHGCYYIDKKLAHMLANTFESTEEFWLEREANFRKDKMRWFKKRGLL